MFVALLVTLTSAWSPAAVCSLDANYSCCQECQVKKMACEEKAKSDHEQMTVMEHITCPQQKDTCEKYCERKMFRQGDALAD